MFKVYNKDKNHVLDVLLVSSLLIFTHCSGVSIFGFEQVNGGWE